MDKIFKDKAHQDFYKQQIAKTKAESDPYRKALFYTLGLTEDTRLNIKQLYDYSDNCIDFDGLKKGWQTETSQKVCRLAFNLYNGWCGDEENGEDTQDYTPYELFNCELMNYMLEAVKIRYSGYIGN